MIPSQAAMLAAKSLCQIGFEEDVPYLRKPLIDVNMRLLRDNEDYRDLVEHAIDLIVSRLNSQYLDYSNPIGMSGANVGIPWNIIAYKNGDEEFVMINPSYEGIAGSGTSTIKTNCGSLRLPKKISVVRFNHIDVSFFDEDGQRYQMQFKGKLANTIQHEVDHNKGILITDRQV